MSKFVTAIIPLILEGLLKVLAPEKLTAVADKALDWCELAIAKSTTDLDDTLVVPLIGIVREAFHIPDNDV